MKQFTKSQASDGVIMHAIAQTVVYYVQILVNVAAMVWNGLRHNPHISYINIGDFNNL